MMDGHDSAYVTPTHSGKAAMTVEDVGRDIREISHRHVVERALGPIRQRCTHRDETDTCPQTCAQT